MLTDVRRYWPFLVFAAIAAVHVVQLAVGDIGFVTKAVLMPSLLAAILASVLVTARIEVATPSVIVPMLLLEFAILTAWLTDIFFQAPPATLGIAASGIAHLFLVVLFAWPLRARWRSLVVIPYAAALVVTVVVLWPGFGAFAPLIAVYATIIYAMAYLASRVSLVTGIGGGLFIVSAIIKGLGLFLPQVVAGIPQPAFDAVVMACYAAGMGLIALGSVRRIVELELAAVPLRRASARRRLPGAARREALPTMR